MLVITWQPNKKKRKEKKIVWLTSEEIIHTLFTEPFARSSPQALQPLGRCGVNKQEPKHFCFLGRKWSASSCHYPPFYNSAEHNLTSALECDKMQRKAPVVTILPEFLACRVWPCRCSSVQQFSNPNAACLSSDRRNLPGIVAKWGEGMNGTIVRTLSPSIPLFWRLRTIDSTEILLCAAEVSCLDN